MEFDWSRGGLAEGLRCYKAREYWNAHEHWEDVWRACTPPDKSFMQALIQITAGFYHVQRGNHVGAVSLLGRALHRLQEYPTRYGGVHVGELRASLQVWLDGLKNGTFPPQLQVPVIVP